MPIRAFLAKEAFDPETIREMSLALERICADQRVPVKDDDRTRKIAEIIIGLAQRGILKADRLHTMASEQLRRS